MTYEKEQKYTAAELNLNHDKPNELPTKQGDGSWSFQKDSKILEGSLIGQWAWADNSSETEVIYGFLRNDSRKVRLFDRGQDIEMTDFGANCGGQFSFEYLENDSKVIVVAQFNSYDRQTLWCIQRQIGAGESFKPMIVLDKVVVD
ncbi:MAG: hypothetical protein ACJAS3_003023 [Roseivirga sp.]